MLYISILKKNQSSINKCSNLPKVNVRVGRKGYYEREDAVDKVSKMDVIAFDSNEAIGASPDLSTKVFKQTSKSIAPANPDPLDALDLPFFKMGHHPELGCARSSGAASSSAPSTVTLTSLPAIEAPSMLSLQDHEGDGSGSDNEIEPSRPPMMSHMDVIQKAFPKHSAKEPKTSAKAAPKMPAQKARSQPLAAKKRSSADADATPQPKAKILRLHDQPDAKTTPGNAGPKDGDRELLADYNEQMKALKEKSLAGINDTEAGITDNLKTANKDLIALANKIRTKKKSLKRRKDATFLNDGLENIIQELVKVADIADAMAKFHGTTEHYATMKSFKVEWNMSSAFFKRVFKCMALHALKFADWGAFLEIRGMLHADIGYTNGELYFEILVSDVIQRLLRALPTKDLG